MKLFKALVNCTLGILLAFDVVIAFQAYKHGWPKDVKIAETQPGVNTVTVIRHPFTTADAAMLAVLICVHLLLIYLIWHLHKRTSRQPRTHGNSSHGDR